MKNFTKAFTLIELLIVIVIIGILAVALIPRLTGAQARARDTARIADIRQIEAALSLYAMDNKGNYPSIGNPVCIGAPEGVRCRPGYIQSTDATPGALAFGNDNFMNIMKNYITSFPTDPQPQRQIGNRYIYHKGNVDINCSSLDRVFNKARLFWVPEKSIIGISNNQANTICAPGKTACCSDLGCSVSRFCAYQID